MSSVIERYASGQLAQRSAWSTRAQGLQLTLREAVRCSAMDGPERSWKVGELARATGLTIRALHHYDEIGLLVPARTQSGHRVYGPDDVERLYRVLALRGVGMALQDIAAALDDDGASLVDIVRRHVAAVERDIERRRRLLDRLREMLAALERSPAPRSTSCSARSRR